jgi:hypothetical protein
MRLPLVRFLVADSIAAAVGHTLLFFLSYQFTDSVRDLVARVEGDVNRLRPLLILLPILAFGIYLLVHFLRKPVPTADPEELPILGPQVAAKIESTDRPPEVPTEAPAPVADGTPSDQITAHKPGS